MVGGWAEEVTEKVKNEIVCGQKDEGRWNQIYYIFSCYGATISGL